MAEPKTEIEKRLDRIELAIKEMSSLIAHMQKGYHTRSFKEKIEKILRGEKSGEKFE